MDEHTLSADEVVTLARLMWGSRFSAGSEELAAFLGINHRNALRLLSGEMRANVGISAELVAEFRTWLLRSRAPAANIIRQVLEPHLDCVVEGSVAGQHRPPD